MQLPAGIRLTQGSLSTRAKLTNSRLQMVVLIETEIQYPSQHSWMDNKSHKLEVTQAMDSLLRQTPSSLSMTRTDTQALILCS